MAAAGYKSCISKATAALFLLLLPLLLSSTVSEAARNHGGGRKWEAPIIYPSPAWNPPIVYPSPVNPPPRSEQMDMGDLPSGYIDEQAPAALPENDPDESLAPVERMM
ncbi:hypothetical protein HU200_053382 [Digitaria exilis]|uniref:Uncharacterized protein n=1 Tax=Digitaria exilis TaxID=1010633 RepID=A0A835E7U4_9POAL|nr:hypothetical protein HU200_053382 [Digitaria exilis]